MEALFEQTILMHSLSIVFFHKYLQSLEDFVGYIPQEGDMLFLVA